ncbi:hypothetical protein F4009_25000 [Candidatus Poribacteria bacterium]|nr:hypothetical protein [Candidatus Poribacteria bacterium]
MRETLARQQRFGLYLIALFLMSLFSGTPAIAESETTTYHWEIGEEPSGQETVFVPQPIEVETEAINTQVTLLPYRL